MGTVSDLTTHSTERLFPPQSATKLQLGRQRGGNIVGFSLRHVIAFLLQLDSLS